MKITRLAIIHATAMLSLLTGARADAVLARQQAYSAPRSSWGGGLHLPHLGDAP